MRIMLKVVFGIGPGPRSEDLAKVLTDMMRLSGSCPMLLPRLRVKLGPNSVGWIAEEIDEWIAARVAERNRTRSGPPEVAD